MVAGPSAQVNCFVGTESTGNTYPGATLPHGMVQLSPVAIPPSGGLWLYNSGYHRVKGRAWSHFAGFGHTALSGTGLNDGGDFALLPCTGACGGAR